MILLAIDTSYGPGSLALVRQEAREVVSLPPEWKSTTLHGELSQLLARHGLRTSEIDAYAVANGPGAFTGLRIGLTTAKALAEVHGKPILTISTLEVVAHAGRERLPARFSGHLAALLDARRGQVYASLYRELPQGLQPVIGETVCALQRFLAHAKDVASGETLFCGPEIELFEAGITEAGWERASLITVASSLADTLASLAITRLKMGLGDLPAAAEANYVRPSDAEIFWKG
jgi:tRNA threonylcarbamoyladenosine biosynthesis protein TsaB